MFILRQTSEARDRSIAAVFDGEYARFGSFNEFAHRHQMSTHVEVTWGFSPNLRRSLSFPLPPSIGATMFRDANRIRQVPTRTVSVNLQGVFGYNRLTSEVRAEQVRIHSQMFVSGAPPETSFWNVALFQQRESRNWSRLTYATPELQDSGSYRIRETGKFYDLSLGHFHGREPQTGRWDRINLRRLALQLAYVLEEEAAQLTLLGPLRPEAQRFYLMTGSRPSDVGLAGEKAIELLWMERGRSIAGIGHFVRKWLQRLDLSLDLTLRRIPRTSFVSVDLQDPRTGVTVQLADVGVGASQIIPILIGGYIAPPGSTLVIEQPELHLHPAAQAEVADALIDLIQDGRRFVVETHSEHLVRRLQRRIADDTIDPKDVALYFVEESESGSQLKEIGLEENGRFIEDELPDGFFDVDYKEVQEIVKARSATRDQT
jgi:hypothetical protein